MTVKSLEEERAITGTALVGASPAEVSHAGPRSPCTWQPGMPIRTEQDKADWQKWRRERILAAQRYRRAHMRRIDYYVSPEADAIINRLRRNNAGGDASSIIDRIIGEWAAGCGFPE